MEAHSRPALPPHMQQLPPFQPVQPEPPLNPRELGVGNLAWIRPQFQCQQPVHCIRDGHDKLGAECVAFGRNILPYGGFDHPCLITGIFQRPHSFIPGDLLCNIVQVHSFKKTTLERWLQRFSAGSGKFVKTIPIFQGTYESIGYMKEGLSYVFLEHGRLPEQSYVCYEHTYQVPISSLRLFSRKCKRGHDIRITAQSYLHLMNLMHTLPGSYVPSDWLAATAIQRLHGLANHERVRSMFAQPAKPLPQIVQARTATWSQFTEIGVRRSSGTQFKALDPRQRRRTYGPPFDRKEQGENSHLTCWLDSRQG